ncbi:MAG: hypothetical protein K0S65_4775, partial [Labilithrix sp.]|nr:hypothetical protein [Labilithrix sp.]
MGTTMTPREARTRMKRALALLVALAIVPVTLTVAPTVASAAE